MRGCGHLKYGSFSQQPLRQVLAGQFPCCLQLLVPVPGLWKDPGGRHRLSLCPTTCSGQSPAPPPYGQPHRLPSEQDQQADGASREAHRTQPGTHQGRGKEAPREGRARPQAPVQECAPHSPASRCRHPLHAHSPWRALPAEPSSCTPGMGWQSSRTGGAGPCGRQRRGDRVACLAQSPALSLVFTEASTSSGICRPGDAPLEALTEASGHLSYNCRSSARLTAP